MKTVALAGNPNVGKSTLFNALTGLHQHTGNWTGKTVDLAVGECVQGARRYRFLDLPGTYSLEGQSQEERIASAYLSCGQADCVVVVCDGSALERSLILALQVLERTPCALVCVNLMDEARNRGIQVDEKKLQELLRVPVVLTAAGSRLGLGRLLDAIDTVPGTHPRGLWTDPAAQAAEIAARCVTRGADPSAGWRKTLDRLLLSQRHGFPVLLATLFVIIWLTVWGANIPSQALERLFDRGYGLLKNLLEAAPWWLSGILVDGLYATSARVIAVMLPPMAIFFPLFTLLEDVGYLPRMAFLMDKSMCRCGGCGKQALTLCMGLGCNAVGVTGCRIIGSQRERELAMLTNAMVPCNGRFPTLILLGTLFFGDAGALVVAGSVILGIAGAMGTSWVLSKTILRHKESAFLLELPPFRRPRVGQIIWRSLVNRTLFVAGRALTVAAPAGMVLWVLANTGLLGKAAAVLDPMGTLLGMNGVILLAFCLSLPANELLISIILMTLTGAGTLAGVSGFGGEQLLLAGWTVETAICTMVFTLFHWPCATTLLTIHHETGSVKKTAAAFLLPTAVGMLLCALLNAIL